MIRTGITFLIFPFLIGCSVPKTIDAPTKKFYYTETTEQDAELSLTLSFELEKHGIIGGVEFYLKKEAIPEEATVSSPAMSSWFADGDDWAAHQSVYIEFESNAVPVSVSAYQISDDMNYDIDVDFNIGYSEKGSVLTETNNFKCNWKWTEIKSPNQRLEPTPDGAAHP